MKHLNEINCNLKKEEGVTYLYVCFVNKKYNNYSLLMTFKTESRE